MPTCIEMWTPYTHFWVFVLFLWEFFWGAEHNPHLQIHFSNGMPIAISFLISGLKALELHWTVMESQPQG